MAMYENDLTLKENMDMSPMAFDEQKIKTKTANLIKAMKCMSSCLPMVTCVPLLLLTNLTI
jgi:hypothetical protein